MNKLFAALLVSTLIGMLPVLAEDAKPKAKKSPSSSSSSEDLNFGDVVNGLAYTGTRLVKCTAGLALGTPVAVLRKTLRTTHDTSKSIAGDKGEAVSLAAEALVLPVGIFVGGLNGLGWSVSNSWKNSEYKKPFDIQKELFSLGALEE